ncbi:MAG: methionine--tRNA ligase [Candidatus Nomurabacteria bacterium]|nr:methionine--tRNA ligase [Candidatus Nomurabacteria bacterium]
MKNQNSFYITTTLPYVNADLHMGHALEFIRADIIARYKKLNGYDVFFNTGTDEHGMKIYEKAVAAGKTPQEFVNDSFFRFKDSVNIFGMDESILHFARTTNENHINSAQAFWKKVYDNGYIYKKNYEARYCVGCEETKSDSEIVNDECPIHPGRALEIIQEENYFFKYSAFTEKLLNFYKENPNFVVPDFRFNEIKAFVERGLQDFSISRLKDKMPWGIPVPGDEEHVMYVWFDALTNYISTLGWPEASGDFDKYWVNGNPTQYCGKDNLRFQSAMWQAMLMAADVPNSHQIIINGFITADGGVKMSKTLGNVIDPKDIVSEYGTDALRFFLAKEVSSFEDSPFTMERFKDAYNAGLANGIGNLTSRIMKMAETNLETITEIPAMTLTEDWAPVIVAMDNFNIHEAMNLVFKHVTELDELIQTKQPFKLVKTNKEEAVEIIKELVIKLHNIGMMLTPVLPETSKKIVEIAKSGKMPEQPLFLRKD